MKYVRAFAIGSVFVASIMCDSVWLLIVTLLLVVSFTME